MQTNEGNNVEVITVQWELFGDDLLLQTYVLSWGEIFLPTQAFFPVTYTSPGHS